MILIISGEVDLRGFGKWGHKAITNRAYITFPTKRAGASPPHSPAMIAPLGILVSSTIMLV